MTSNVGISGQPLTSNTPTAASAEPRLFECHECGQRRRLALHASSRTVKCDRCRATVVSLPRDSLNRSLALTITAVILAIVADTMPFMSLSLQGIVQHANLITGVGALFDEGLWPLATVVLFTTVIAPACKLGGLLYVLLGLRLPRPPRDLPQIFRWLRRLTPWSMVEVYLLGVFVAYVKLAAFATVDVGVACLSLAALMVVMVAIDATLSPELVWRAMERRGLVTLPPPAPEDLAAPLVRCEHCGLVAHVGHGHRRCARCGAACHYRKATSVARSWALVLTALILYVPANFYPVMTVVSFGKGEPDTILSGVKELFLGGMWPLALLVFFASITVPVLKIAGLIYLLVSTQSRSRRRLRDRALLYRIVEAIGRWSMIDIFMLSILAGLVRLGSLATIAPGVGSISFACVVILTMFAAAAFDPRLMWDAAGENR